MLDYERVTAPLSLRTRSGEPLLLLHGLGTSRRDFTAVIPALTDRFDVINVDLPGIGRSPHLEQRPTVAAITDAVEHTLDAAGLDRVHATRKGARSTETALHRTRVLAGGLTEDELAVDNYDDLTVSEVASAVLQLTDAAALTALLRYEQNHKQRAGAVTAIQNRLAALAEQDISGN